MLILHHLDDTNLIDGNVINIFDYYLLAKKSNMNITLIFFLDSYLKTEANIVTVNKILTAVLKSRYVDYKLFEFKIYLSNIYLKSTILKNLCDKIIITDKSYYEITNTLKLFFIHKLFKQIYIINTWFSFFKKQEYNNTVKIFNENNNTGKSNYIKKIYFDGLLNIYNDNAAFVLSNGERSLSVLEILEIEKLYSSKFKIIYICSNQKYNINSDSVRFIDTYKTNFLFDFNTYIHIGSKNYDYAPRMLIESAFLGKNILFYRCNNTIINSIRVQDALNKNFKKYNLTLNDEIYN